MVAEIARVTRDRFLVTVPDMGVLPHLISAHVVPRHLLERTHRWGFTERSRG